MLRVKRLVFCFYLGLLGSILQFRQNIIKVGSRSWLLTCSSNITLSLPSYTGSALKRELSFCNGYLSLLYFCTYLLHLIIGCSSGGSSSDSSSPTSFFFDGSCQFEYFSAPSFSQFFLWILWFFKGQLILQCPYELIVFSKIPIKIFPGFLP